MSIFFLKTDSTGKTDAGGRMFTRFAVAGSAAALLYFAARVIPWLFRLGVIHF